MPTRDARLDSHSIARLEVFNTLTNSNYHTSRLMSNDTIALENKRSNTPRLPEMDI
jgi:hypothetical protein